MRIIVTGGGTGGHIYPALAVAGYIMEKEPDSQILYIGATGGMEEKLVPKAGYSFRGITISGFQRKLTLKNIGNNLKTCVRVFSASREAKRLIREFKPDVCMGTGGYVSGPVIREAAKLKIPTVIHESNAFPGMTTKALAKSARAVMLAVPDASKYLPENTHCVITGNPIRGEVLETDRGTAREKLGMGEEKLILSFGGSLGARKINEAVAPLLVRSARDKRYYHIHAYGQYGKWLPGKLCEMGLEPEHAENLDIREYISDMNICLAAADLVICRAGAITLSELEAQGKAAILIPSPNVAENHQYHNAMALVRRGAAELIEDKDLTGESLMQKVDSVFSETHKIKEMGENAAKLAITNARERIYTVIRSVIDS